MSDPTEPELVVELVDGTDPNTIALIIVRDTGEGIDVAFKGIKVTRFELALILSSCALELSLPPEVTS